MLPGQTTLLDRISSQLTEKAGEVAETALRGVAYRAISSLLTGVRTEVAARRAQRERGFQAYPLRQERTAATVAMMPRFASAGHQKASPDADLFAELIAC
jgi:hypothetical protein